MVNAAAMAMIVIPHHGKTRPMNFGMSIFCGEAGTVDGGYREVSGEVK